MGLEQLAMSGVAAVGRHRRVSDALFRFTKWGNPFADERFSWPYPMYDRMRADGPISYGRPYRQWFVFGYEEVQQLLRSPDTATAPVGELLLSTRRYRRLSHSARANFGRWLVAGLTFQLAADILETSITTTWQAVARLGAVAAIRTFLNYFLEHDMNEARERRQREATP